MLQETFFQFTSPLIDGKIAKTIISLNAKHQIFDGHFPGQPVVPGVCMMQMIKEVLEYIIGAKTKLVKAGDMKFLAVLNPLINNSAEMILTYNLIEDNTIKLDALIQHDAYVFFKFKGVFKNEAV